MKLKRGPRLSSYMAELLSQGRGVFSGTEAQAALGISRGAFLDAAEKLQRSEKLACPRRDFYVIVPPQGAPSPASYIDALMKHEAHPYYVGLMSTASELHVVTTKRLPEIRIARTLIEFYYRKDMLAVASAVEQRATESGFMNVSSAELTALDLMRYPNAGGGLDAIPKILTELGARLDPDKLALLSGAFERSVVQRLGYLLSKLDHADRVKSLHERLLARAPIPWVELQSSSLPPERNSTWRVTVRSAQL